MLKAAVLLACGIAFSGYVVADDSGNKWVRLTESHVGNKKFFYSAKGNTFKTDGNSSSIIVQLKAVDTTLDDTSITYYKVVMTDQACNDGYGKIQYFSLDEKPVTSADYIKDGESVASAIGDIICMVRDGKRKMERN